MGLSDAPDFSESCLQE